MVEFTPSQLDAVYARQENLLISAGAGSGKTTVLVERVLQLLQEGIAADRLLVLTFTRAAADQMRSRIDSALRQRLTEQPGLSRQLPLLAQAQISTIHSFCMELLRRYHYQVDLPAGFRVANEAECEELALALLEDIMEEGYGREDSGLAALADAYGGPQDDGELVKLILSLRKYSLSRPCPEQWLREAAKLMEPGEALDEMNWAPYLRQRLAVDIRSAAAYFQEAEALAAAWDLPMEWQSLAAEDVASSLEVAAEPTLSGMLEALSRHKLGRLPGIKDIQAADIAEKFKELRKDGRELLNKIKERYVLNSAEQELQNQRELAGLMHTLVFYVIELEQRLSKEKRQRGWVDYSDLEHFVLELLSREQVCRELRKQYQQILIDEYQDINQVQEEILSRLRNPGGFFAVGDVKQSVYRFRLAEPGLFLEKYNLWGKVEGGRRIDLNSNYRSTPQVINGINSLFSQLMYEEVAELDYDEDAALHPGLSEEGPLPELWLLPWGEDEEEEETESSLAQEAAFIAKRAAELHREGYAWEDMVILRRSMKREHISQLTAALSRENIPWQTWAEGDFFSAAEIQISMSLLQVIDNPCQDRPLAALLISPMLGFFPEELLEMRLNLPEGSMWQALKLWGEQYKDSKAARFLEQLQRWRQKAAEQPLSRLLPSVWQETGFYQFVGALPEGASRQGRLSLLQHMAGEQEALGGGLYGFLGRLQQMAAPGRQQPGLPPDNSGQGIRLMTIHKSKGLEFPVVFVSGCSSRFNFRDEYADVVWERSLGFGARLAERQSRKKYNTLCHLAITGKMRDQALAEEMRVYYVALTRAKQRLILTAAGKSLRKRVEQWQQLSYGGESLPLHLAARADSPLSWIGPALLRPDSPAAPHWLVVLGSDIGAVEDESPAAPTDDDGAVEDESPAAPTDDDGAVEDDSPAAPELAQVLEWQYPHRELCSRPSKWTVSALNRRMTSQNQQEESARWLPVSPEGSRDGAVKGSAVHLFLQNLRFGDNSPEHLEEELQRLLAQGRLTAEEGAMIPLPELSRWLGTELGQRLCRAEQLWRELPFTMMGPEGELIQGVIDAAFFHQGGWVLLDYKTGHKHTPEQKLIETYQGQLSLYAQALSRMLHAPVAEAWLCLVESGRNLLIGMELGQD